MPTMNIESAHWVKRIRARVWCHNISKVICGLSIAAFALTPKTLAAGDLSKRSVVGNYVGKFDDGVIHLLISRNGTYQLKFDGGEVNRSDTKFPFGKSYSVQSGWDIESGRIRFSSFANPGDLYRQGFPTMHTFFYANFDKRSGTIRFVSQTNLIVRKLDAVKP